MRKIQDKTTTHRFSSRWGLLLSAIGIAVGTGKVLFRDFAGGTAIHGSSSGATGYGVVGIHQSSAGVGYGIWGRTLSPDGWAGYFRGRGYFEGFLGKAPNGGHDDGTAAAH